MMVYRVLSAVLLVMTVGIQQVEAQSFGRLFTTPEQRAELDEIRADPDFGKEPEVEVAEVEATPDGAAVPHVTINGVVFRSSGVNATWINGLSIPSSDATREGIRVQTRQLSSGGSVRLSMPGGLETVEIKPGQKIDLLHGGVFEPYEFQAEENTDLFEEIPESDDMELPELDLPDEFESDD